MDADKRSTESLETPVCNSSLQSLSRNMVEVLLGISEENLDVGEIPNQTGWDEAIQGWSQCSPFSCLFTAHQRSKTLKPDSSASHCVLCTTLKDLKRSGNVAPSPGASEASYKASKEHSRSNIPSLLEHLNRSPSTVAATSSPEEKMVDITLGHKSFRKDLLDHNSPSGPVQYTPDKLLSRLPEPDATCPIQEDRNAGKAELPDRVMVLPSVIVSPNPTTHPKNSHFLKREDSGDTRLINATGVDGEQEKYTSIPYSKPTSQGTVPVFQTQNQHYLLSALNNPRRYQTPKKTMAETQPRAPSLLERNLRQELITATIQHKAGHRSQGGVKEKNLRRPEPQLPMLLGTRIQIPVSTHRLL